MPTAQADSENRNPSSRSTPRGNVDRSPDPTLETVRERFGAFYVVYVGLFVLLFAYLISARLAEVALGAEFQSRVERAIVIRSLDRSISEQMKEGIESAVHSSAWVRWGGLRVSTLVLAQDGSTWLYVDGNGSSSPPGLLSPAALFGQWMKFLPATAQVTVTLPHNALISNTLLIFYSTILLSVVYASNRRLTGRENQRLEEALTSRNQSAGRAAEIEEELAATRSRLAEIEPVEREQNQEVQALQRERQALQNKLVALTQREEALRSQAAHALGLEQEVNALEDLLEEATGDLEIKDSEIDRLEQNLKRVSRMTGKARSKAASHLTRRFRTLYKTIEIDERAIDEIAALGDESLRLKAEECLKRLAEDADNVSVRRKVGGLPNYVQIFELGFAGKGRIYYMRGKSRRFRILLVGAKNTQSADLDYLAGLPKEEFN